MTNIKRFDTLLKQLEAAGVAPIRIEALDAELRPKYEILDKRIKEQNEAIDDSLKALAGWINMHDISVREEFEALNAPEIIDTGWGGTIVQYMKESK